MARLKYYINAYVRMEKETFMLAIGGSLPHGCSVSCDTGTADRRLVLALRSEPSHLAFELLNGRGTGIFFKTLHYVRSSKHSKGRDRSSIPHEFYDEYRSASHIGALAPQFVPEIFGYITVGGRFFGYFMKEINGGTLTDAIVENDAARITSAVKRLRALTKIIHPAGVPHGDLNSGNVLFDSPGPKVLVVDPSGYYPDKIPEYNAQLGAERTRKIMIDWLRQDIETIEFYERLLVSGKKLTCVRNPKQGLDALREKKRR
jgi:hypothetical protein